ncbi:ankyrin repeat domain-containing protein [Legionella sp. PATHC038]|uniref:ankyrin repeat domain-containing protein n=1 Tax=Legionella sheltonii TaxID=2992041 RepID=UPI0022447729|nr:ankyrin repeat domain-containing protein [Legionella sp. PATHC038]MCW8397283.1 ankyrin repeat domain-containing protein [Legionella sp. PATHC038]
MSYQQKEMTTEYLTLLREKINAMIPKPTQPVGLVISGHGLRHAITVCFNPKQDKWILIDANTPPAQEYSDDGAIAQALLIEGACSTNGTGVINTRVFTMSGNEPLQHVLTEWKQEVKRLSEQDMASKTKWEDYRGGTLLNTVVYNNNYELIPRLAEQGADVNKPTIDKFTPLLIAIFRNNIESVQELLKCGAKLETHPYNINTPLRVAIAKKNMDIVKILLENGADPNFRPYCSETAFEDAIIQNDYELVKLMLEYGASTSPLNYKFRRVIEGTLSRGYLESFKALLEHGFKPDDPEHDNNLLLLAVQNNQFELAKLFLEYGANPSEKDTKRNESAREYAEKNNLVDFLDLFNHPPEATQKNAAPKDDAQAIYNFIEDLKKYCVTRRAEWDLLPKWMHINKKDVESARYKTTMNVLKFGFSVEDKIKAAEKLIDALQNKEGREPLSDFDIAALLSSRLYSTVVAKHESTFNALEEIIDYKNRTQENKKFSNRAA